MKHEKPYVCSVSNIILEFEPHKNPMNKNLRSISVMLRRHKLLGVGDKLSSRMGQKAVAVHICQAEDMPVCIDARVGGIDMIVDPLSMISRCTVSQEASSALGLDATNTGTLYSHEPFTQVNYSTHKTGILDGITGTIRKGVVDVGVEYYMVLRHIADNKIRSSAASQRDPMTGAISGESCVRFNWQEMAAMLHGRSYELASHVYSVDKGYYPYCSKCNRDTDGNVCGTCGEVVEERVSVSRSLMTLKKIMGVLGVGLKITQSEDR
jgi:hypothetical protein